VEPDPFNGNWETTLCVQRVYQLRWTRIWS